MLEFLYSLKESAFFKVLWYAKKPQGMPLERAYVIKSKILRMGLIACALLVLTPCITSLPAFAEGDSYYDPGLQPMDRYTFNASPQSLLSNPNMLGANVNNLLQQGVNPSQIATVLNGSGANIGQWTQVLNGIASGNMNPNTAAGLVQGLFGNQLPPEAAQALSMVRNLGNLTDINQIAAALGMPDFRNIFNGLNAQQAAVLADQVLGAFTGGQGVQGAISQLGVSAVANILGQQAPQLLTALGGQAGLQAAIGQSLQQMSLGGITGGIGGIGTSNPGGVAAAVAGGAYGGGGGCCGACSVYIPQHHNSLQTENSQLHTEIKNQISTEIQQQNSWMFMVLWHEHILRALMMMAEQLTAMGMLQVETIGTFLDAKHQLETQRLFQQMTAKAHKDYHPSEGMCTFGTTVRSLAASERKSNLAQLGIAQRMMQRQALSGDVLSRESVDSDIRSRLRTYISNYCDQADNANGLGRLCRSNVPAPEKRNIDVDYTRNIESRLTLDLDFLPGGNQDPSPDERDVFALSANLYAHNVPPRIAPELLGTRDGKIRQDAVERYMDLRSVFAQRSVAENSFSAITALRAAGTPESAPYTKAILKELGVSSDAEINQLLGNNPSYFAQMEVLTKKIYQNPLFYTELYDKPANIERKGAALQAIALMQDRDFYNSLLRSEAVLSVLLETMLETEQERVVNAMGDLTPVEGAR